MPPEVRLRQAPRNPLPLARQPRSECLQKLRVTNLNRRFRASTGIGRCRSMTWLICLLHKVLDRRVAPFTEHEVDTLHDQLVHLHPLREGQVAELLVHGFLEVERQLLGASPQGRPAWCPDRRRSGWHRRRGCRRRRCRRWLDGGDFTRRGGGRLDSRRNVVLDQVRQRDPMRLRHVSAPWCDSRSSSTVRGSP